MLLKMNKKLTQNLKKKMETTIMYQNQSLNAKLNISNYVNISLCLKYILSLPLKNTTNMTWAKAQEKSQAQI